MKQKLTAKQQKSLREIIIAGVLLAILMVVEHTESIPLFNEHSWTMLLACLVPYLLVGRDVVRLCIKGILNRQLLDERFLMTIATIGAFATEEYCEAVAVMLFYQVGEFFQSYAVGKSRESIQQLLTIAPEYANVIAEDGSVETVDPDDVEIGDVLLVKPGEKIPVDGTVIEGSGLINTSALTGESMPREVQVGDAIISGCVNGESLLKVRADKLYDDSTVAQILELVENAATKKSKTESFITRFARYYTPIVVAGAAILAFIPPIFFGEFTKWMLRACTFLVISCPCALVISVPLAFFGGIGAASKAGVLVKGSNYLEMMANLDTIVSDKTGTLTQGKFKVSAVNPAADFDKDSLMRYAAAVEQTSTHPIAVSICEAYKDEIDPTALAAVENLAGRGITANFEGRKLAVGNMKLMNELGVAVAEDAVIRSGTCVYIAVDGVYVGSIEVADAPKSEAVRAITDIRAEHVKNIVMLTGDAEDTAKKVAAELGITEYRAELLPQDKVSVVEELLEKVGVAGKGKLAFIGDGINDAPVLTRADVGIAMGSLGSDAAIEAADIVIMDDNLERIPTIIRIARKTIGISKANIAFALAVKIACLVLGAAGIVGMWGAVFADVGVAFICILNSMRTLAKNA
ncbi:MAG: heavy metal translocating P-type ATPase [Firmicutes bacterium]|nr:heavy metal translocating P-type ATPase [Bacillota bacterium]